MPHAMLSCALVVAVMVGLADTQPAALAATTLTANWTSPQQTIDNFSASDSWCMQNLGLWADSNKTVVADLLFTTNFGIGLSAWRFNFGAGIDPTITDPWRTTDGFLVSSNNYDWTRQPGQRWFLRAAKARGVPQFIGVVYSPPTNYTRNSHSYCTTNTSDSTNLRVGYEAAFAQYLADILQHFQTNSDPAEQVVFNYISPFNEPYWDWNSPSQEGNRAANSDIINEVVALSSALGLRGLPTQIQLAEAGDIPGLYQQRGDTSSRYGKPYANYMNSLTAITNLITRNICGHSYFTDDPATQLVQYRQTLRSQLNANPFWRYWESEYCILGSGGPHRDFTINTALNVGRVVWADLTLANAAAWDWWLSVSRYDYKDGLLYTDFTSGSDPQTLYSPKNFWAFGHWSRFIRPGWQRIDLSGGTDLNGLLGAAFKDNTDNLAFVLLNEAATNQNVTLNINNVPAGKVLRPWSAWLTSDAPQDNLAPLPPAAAGSTFALPARSIVTLVGGLDAVGAGTAPVLSTISDQTNLVGRPFNFSFVATAPGGPASLISFSVSSDNPALIPAGNVSLSSSWPTGTITREFFTNINGSTVSNLACAPFFPGRPASSNLASTFEAPQGQGNFYGQRMSGFVSPPLSGAYTFWIASDDGSELYLSTDENPANKTRIAWVNGYTGSRQWLAQTNQQSASITLTAGHRYFIEAVHKQGNGGDNLAVGWQLPGGAFERPIPGSRLSPWTDPSASQISQVLSVQPAPGATGQAAISLVATDAEGRRATNTFTLTIAGPPRFDQIAAIDGQIILRGSRGLPGQTFYLLSSTNITLPLQLWTPIATNSFAADGTSLLTNTMNPNIPQMFYLIQVP